MKKSLKNLAAAALLALMSAAASATDIDFDSLGRPMPVPAAAMAKVLGYTGQNVTTVTANAPDGSQYIKTLTYSGSTLTNVSGWVKQ